MKFPSWRRQRREEEFVIALLTGLGPARRAGRVDPAVTLRSD